ncbi:MAG: crosslink repair DNA glycosylase YcaQ family protein, partial [Dermabacter sp.]|nr:crosslink repair DNA glycosylase YcaQ family protein [Dermabacter sp.]
FGGDKVAATAALLERYLASHGPATLRDFAWWTKLPLRQIRAAALQIGDGIEEWGSDAAGETLFCRAGLADEVSSAAARVRGTFLLPGFDELVLGYPDRLALMTEQEHALLVPGNNGVFRR